MAQIQCACVFFKGFSYSLHILVAKLMCYKFPLFIGLNWKCDKMGARAYKIGKGMYKVQR